MTSLFEQKKTGYSFKAATGWGSETLLIVTTTKENGTNGPSYWFVIDTRAFLQLIAAKMDNE